MATLIRYSPSGLTREQYDKVNEILQSTGNPDPPNELKLHVLFGEDGDLRVSEIWDSEAAWRETFQNAIGPALEQAGVSMGGEPEILEVHELWGSGIANP
jgi:hypothetical protein